MTRKIFAYSFALGAAAILICSVIFFSMQYTQTIEETYKALQGEASYAVSGLEVGGIRFLRSLENINRITWIDRDGSVLYDSEYPDLTANQAGFREVETALREGTGRGIRKSSSTGVQTMYCAFLCRDGTVLRLSRPVRAVREALLAVTPVLGGILLVLIISAIAAFRIANAIALPINRMDLDDLSNADVYPELNPLLERLKDQRRTIEKEAEEREGMRREFSANVSHELKTPLTSISGFAELMQSGLCDEEKMIEFAGDIYRESQRMITLINDIIRLSELDEGAVAAEIEEVDLLQSARNAAKTLEPAAGKRRVTIHVEGETGKDGETGAPDQPVCVPGSAHLIDEMVYNLCDNAVKYNREGGEVTIRVWKERDRACLSVEDNGIGIPADEQERVFERFYRVDKSHSRQIGGTGLGLSIVKHAAQFHKAAIQMDSQPGRGTKITLKFPLSRGE